MMGNCGVKMVTREVASWMVARDAQFKGYKNRTLAASPPSLPSVLCLLSHASKIAVTRLETQQTLSSNTIEDVMPSEHGRGELTQVDLVCH